MWGPGNWKPYWWGSSAVHIEKPDWILKLQQFSENCSKLAKWSEFNPARTGPASKRVHPSGQGQIGDADYRGVAGDDELQVG